MSKTVTIRITCEDRATPAIAWAGWCLLRDLIVPYWAWHGLPVT